MAERTRNWTGIFYPESAPENWEDIIKNDIVVPCFVSPLHHGWTAAQLDEDKKDHYHIIISFDGPKTKEQVKNILGLIGVVMIKEVNSMRGMCRYLTHMDDKDKEQFTGHYLDLVSVYHTSIRTFEDYVELPEEKIDSIAEMLDFIDAECVTSFYDFLMYCRHNNMNWFRRLTKDSSYVISQAIRSRSWDIKQSENSQYDNEV